jgi:hypothetical protein
MSAENQNARPGEPGTGCSGERPLPTAPARPTQGETEPQLALIKLWLSCGPRARREFLADVRFAYPEIWQGVENNLTGGRGNE